MLIDFRNTGGSGPSIAVEALTATENKVYTAPDGTAYSPVDVQVPIPEFTTEEKTVSITSNGQTIVDKSADKDGMTKVTVDVNVPIPEQKLQEKTIPEITTNGVQSITPDAGFDGMSKLDFTVNVPSGGGKTIRLADHPEIRFAYSNITTFPLEYYDFSGVTIANNMFMFCSQLTTLPNGIDFSSVQEAYEMFSNCENLTSLPNGISFSSVLTASSMFNGCYKLTSLPNGISFSSVHNVSYMFGYCTNLTSLPELDFGNVRDIENFFGWDEYTKLTDLGGFKNFKIDWNDDCGLNMCPNLTKQSVLNVINDLYDFRANGDASTTKTIKFHSNSLALLTPEETAIATNKGWNLVS